MGKNWHVVVARTGAERDVALRLGRLVDGGFCPSRWLEYRNRGQPVRRLSALLPRLCFGCWETDDPHAWHDVMGTPGVVGLLSVRGSDPDAWHRPRAVQDPVFEDWVARRDLDDVVPELAARVAAVRRFDLGDEVRIVQRYGIYDGVSGTCVWFDTYEPPRETALQTRLGRLYVPTELCERVGDPANLATRTPLSKAKKRKLRQRQSHHRNQALERIAVRAAE